MANKLTSADKAGIKAAFDQFDRNGDGTIATGELAATLKANGQAVSDCEVHDMIKALDYDGSGKVNYVEYESTVASILGYTMDKLDLIMYFGHFDKNSDGKIAKEQLRSVLKTFVRKATDAQVDVTVAEADLNGDGVISISEFAKVLPKIL